MWLLFHFKTITFNFEAINGNEKKALFFNSAVNSEKYVYLTL